MTPASALIAVEAANCIRCASCSSIAPEIFTVVKVSAIIRQPANARERSACEAALLNCPTAAIVWREASP